jgi:hypothetical protein
VKVEQDGILFHHPSWEIRKMGIKKLSPTSPARRYQTYLTNDDLTTDKPH